MSEGQLPLYCLQGLSQGPAETPTITRQSETSLYAVVVWEVSAAVSACPVSVTHTFELVTANLEAKANLSQYQLQHTAMDTQTLVSGYLVLRIWSH